MAINKTLSAISSGMGEKTGKITVQLNFHTQRSLHIIKLDMIREENAVSFEAIIKLPKFYRIDDPAYIKAWGCKDFFENLLNKVASGLVSYLSRPPGYNIDLGANVLPRNEDEPNLKVFLGGRISIPE
jgi:hypothetical protein